MSLVVSAEQILADLAATPIQASRVHEWLPADPETMTPAEALEVLGCSRSALQRMAHRRLVRFVFTRGGHRRYIADSVRARRRAMDRATGVPSPDAGTAHAAPSQPAGRH